MSRDVCSSADVPVIPDPLCKAVANQGLYTPEARMSQRSNRLHRALGVQLDRLTIGQHVGQGCRGSERLLAAMKERFADHGMHQRWRYAEDFRNFLLLHAVDAAHLEGITGAFRQVGQRPGNPF